jgi:amidase
LRDARQSNARGPHEIGAQVIGPMFADRTTLRFAELVERDFGGFTPPPLD